MDMWIGRDTYRGGDNVKVLALLSDLHLDAEDHDRERLHRDLETASRFGARISINGDLHDLILPGDLKRYTRGTDTYDMDAQLNAITDLGYETLRPYVDLIDVISPGNHETAVLKHHHYDITRGVITLLNRDRTKSLPPIHHGGYKGFQRYVYNHAGAGVGSLTFDVFRFHGAAGAHRL